MQPNRPNSPTVRCRRSELASKRPPKPKGCAKKPTTPSSERNAKAKVGLFQSRIFARLQATINPAELADKGFGFEGSRGKGSRNRLGSSKVGCDLRKVAASLPSSKPKTAQQRPTKGRSKVSASSSLSIRAQSKRGSLQAMELHPTKLSANAG